MLQFSIAPPAPTDGSAVILIDGPAEELIVLAAIKKAQVKAKILSTPFPRMALYLGSYYNEAGKPGDALRVLALGIKREGDGGYGQMLPLLFNEKSIAHAALKQWGEALADSEERLRTITDNMPAMIGYMDTQERFRFVNQTMYNC